MSRQQGVALLLVLWALAVLGLLMLEGVTAVRLENRLSLHQLQQTRAELAAEAGMALAVLHLSDPQREQRWRATGQAYPYPFERSRLNIEVRSDAGKVDLNTAAPELVARLARRLGAPRSEADPLATGLQARRASTDTAPLRVLDEARHVPGMNADLFQRLQPYLTVWTGYDEPVAALAPAPVREAMGQPAVVADDTVDPGPVISLVSDATLDTGAHATLRATLLLTLDGGTQVFRVLRWQP